MKILSLPTWLIVKLIRRFLYNHHPWSTFNMKKFYSLHDWNKNQTALAKLLDIVMWVYLVLLVRFNYLIWSR